MQISQKWFFFLTRMCIWNAFGLAVKKRRRRYTLGQPTGCRVRQNVSVKEGSMLSVIWDVAIREIADFSCWVHQTDFARKLKCSNHTCHWNDWHGNMQGNDWHGNMQGNDWHENMQGNDWHGNMQGNDWHGNMRGNDWHENMQGKDWHENMQGKDFGITW